MIVFLIVLVTLGLIFEWLSLGDKLTNITYHSVPSKIGCEEGEIFQIKTSISNYGLKTMSFLKVEEVFPKEIHLVNGGNIHSNGNNILYTNSLYIEKSQKITRTIEASLPKRGLYFLGGCKLNGGDFLGLKENYKEIEQREEIIVFPRLLDSHKICQALSEYYGDFLVKRFYIDDPLLVSSYKDYSGREPMRSISWIQSARKNHLMVKEFDHTMDMSVTILLDIYLHWSDGMHKEQMEYCYSLVRTIGEFLEGKKVSYRLLTNTYIRSGQAVYEVLETAGQGSHHYTMLLYTLGQADSNTFCDTGQLYEMAVSKYAGENTYFYVAPFENEKRTELVQNLQNRLGSQVYTMYASELMEAEENHVQNV